MAPEQADWKRAEELFFAAVELAPEDRRKFLQKECADNDQLRAHIEAMLDADESARTRLGGVFSEAADSLAAQPVPQTGRRIGPYVLVREIGRGGMGTVYHAIRADGEFFQAVAIKLIKRGMDSDMIIRRFRQERHILAQLDHPNIARLLDGGTTEEGQPYLVMDYVDGIPISAYCEKHRPATRQKLQMFLEVCDAVEDAHQKRVVHRDLKPANILVTREGRPKLLDFGIAKWLDPAASPETVVDTFPGFHMLTPDYASPEQIRGEGISERTDIYALGLILFEVLTGEKARKVTGSGAAEVARAICEAPTEKPSTVVTRQSKAPAQLRRELSGDLDNIVLKAMNRDPQRRYFSAAALAADIRNYLDGRPVIARGDSLVYRATKLIRRNALLAALLLAIVIIAVLAGLQIWRPQPAAGQLDSIAVLPFVNLGVQANEDALSDGLTEDIITELALVQGLKVPSRTSVWQYKGKSFDVREAGRSLGVSAVLEGSVRRTENRVRIVAQLISVRDGFHLWAQSYDRATGDTLKIQSDVARRIADELKFRLNSMGRWNQTGRATPDGEATKAYLEGYRLFKMDDIRAEWTSGLPPRMTATIDAFKHATKVDPNFAAAWASLAEVSEWASGLDEKSRPMLRAQAEAAARKALELEPTNALALVTLGNMYLSHDWNLRQAEPYLRKAVEINPRSTGIQADYSDVLVALGRYEEAIEILERAQLLEPTVPRPSGKIAVLLASLQDCGRARPHAQAALSRDFRYRHALWANAFCDETEGKTELAEKNYRAILRLHSFEDRTLASLGSLLARTGRKQEAQEIAANLASMIQRGRRREVFEAIVRLALGERDSALTLLEQAWTLRDPNLLNIHTEPRFRQLASEPRYRAVLDRLKSLQ